MGQGIITLYRSIIPKTSKFLRKKRMTTSTEAGLKTLNSLKMQNPLFSLVTIRKGSLSNYRWQYRKERSNRSTTYGDMVDKAKRDVR